MGERADATSVRIEFQIWQRSGEDGARRRKPRSNTSAFPSCAPQPREAQARPLPLSRFLILFLFLFSVPFFGSFVLERHLERRHADVVDGHVLLHERPVMSRTQEWWPSSAQGAVQFSTTLSSVARSDRESRNWGVEGGLPSVGHTPPMNGRKEKGQCGEIRRPDFFLGKMLGQVLQQHSR